MDRCFGVESITQFSALVHRVIDLDKKEEDIEDEIERIQSTDLKPEDDEIVELSSNEADPVQDKDIDEDEHR